jgi:3D (Asp-Asp-Asp) domain-containing protein
MRRLLLPALLLAFAVLLPAQALTTHAKTVAKAAATEAKTAQAAPHLVMPSSKGARLIAVVPRPSAHQPAAKDGVAKSDKMVKSAPASSAPAVAAAPLPPARLARITAYWTQEDPCTAKHESSTGVRLQQGVCAVDPKLIPYGSLLQIPGMGNYVAVDTGSAVISRQAAVGSGHTAAERNALVVDLFFENRTDAENFAAHGPAYATVSWTPASLAAANGTLNSRALAAIPTLPAGAVYVLAQAPSLADCRLPLAFRPPQLAGM